MRKPYTIQHQKSGFAADFTVQSRSCFMKEAEHEHT